MKVIFIATYDVTTEEFDVQPVLARNTATAKRMVAEKCDNDVLVGYMGRTDRGMKEKHEISWSILVPGFGMRYVMNVEVK